ncbi:MAG: hypothetical protein HOV92_18085 [Streptomyces sp.]|nr:hypothetical protein [Streptomyces sp.]
MPTEVVDLLAHMSVIRAVSLALGLFGTAALVWLLAVEIDYAAHWRAVAADARAVRAQAALTLAALLILTIPTGDPR